MLSRSALVHWHYLQQVVTPLSTHTLCKKWSHHDRKASHAVASARKAETPPSRKLEHKTRLRSLPPELVSVVNELTLINSVGLSLRSVKHSSVLMEHLRDRDKARILAEAMSHTPHPQRARQVLQLAHKLGCKLKQNAYECVAFQLADARHWHLITSVVYLGKQNTGRTTVRLLNWLGRARIERSQYTRLDTLLQLFEEEKLKPNRISFHLLISGYLRNRDLGKARVAFRLMEAAGFPVDASTHALVVSVYRSMGPDKEVQAQAFTALRDVTDATATTILNSLLQLCVDNQDSPGILQLLSVFDQRMTRFDPSQRSGKGSILDDGDKASRKQYIPPDASQYEVIPDAATFTSLVLYTIQRDELSFGFRVAHKMVELGVQPDSGTIAVLIRLYFLAGDTCTAVQVFAEMCDTNHIPVSLLTALGYNCEKRTQLPLHHTGITPTVEVFNALMKGVLGTRGLNGAQSVLRMMRLSGIRPDTGTIETLISHLDKAERARPRRIISLLKTLSSRTLRPTLKHLHVILRSILRREKARLHGVGWEVTAAKFSPSRNDKTRFPHGRISGIAESLDPAAGIQPPKKLSYRRLVQPIIQSLNDRGIRSDRATFSLRIQHDAVTRSDLDSAQAVFQSMLSRGMHPNVYHFSALMEGQAKAGDLEGAKRTMHSAEKAGLKLNAIMFTILIAGHARQGQPEMALHLFHDMVAAGIKPDVPAIDAVASAYFTVGAYRMAKRVLLSLWPLIQPFPKELMGASLKRLSLELRLLHTGRHDRIDLTERERRTLRIRIARLIKLWKAQGPYRYKGRWRLSSNHSKCKVAGR